MKKLTWWFRSVGALYLVLGAMWLPALTAPRIESAIPGFDGAIDGPAYRGFLDYMVMFSLELLVLGAFLVVASWIPRWQEPLVWLVVALSFVRGIIDDVYMIAQGYSAATFLAFIALHAAVIVTGLLFLRGAREAPVKKEKASPAAATV